LNLEIVSLFLLLLLFYVYRRIQTGFGDGDWASFPPQGCLGFFYGIRIRGILAVRKAAGTIAWDKAAFFAGKACEKRAWAWLWVLGMHGWRRR
jgi:hypothetical protein